MDETYDGPFYQGFVFVLVSAAGKANHILTISLQSMASDPMQASSALGDLRTTLRA